MVDIKTARREWKRQKYLAIYGAMIAVQVRDHMHEGCDDVLPETMRRFMEKAHTIAELEEDCDESPSSSIRLLPQSVKRDEE